MDPFKLPNNLLLGSATASLQIEGGDRNNSWFQWAQEGHIKDNTHCITSCDHWNRIDKDISLMKELNQQIYRMGIEWSRIEPQQGVFNNEAIEHYKDEIIKLKEAGIEPLITLHHFSNPLWIENMDGWLNPKVIDFFARYTEVIAQNLGDLVSDWITINEPNVYLAFGFVQGIWPPGHQNILDYFKGAKNMIRSHVHAYKILHKIRKLKGYNNTKVGVANHLRIYDPKNNNFLEKISCKLYEKLFQNIFIDGMGTGKIPFFLGGGFPEGRGNFMDFLGINYYSRDIISFSLNPFELFGKREVKEGSQLNDLGWEIYPEGIFRLAKQYYQKYKVPIYITENGTCDNEDKFRAKYIYDHLLNIKKAIEEGIDIQRYYHWSTMDNFEWIEGLSSRFGLIYVDYNNFKRTIKKSGDFYSMICARHEITKDMIEKYLLGNSQKINYSKNP